MEIEIYSALIFITTTIGGIFLTFSKDIADKTKVKWFDDIWFKVSLTILTAIITFFCSEKKEKITERNAAIAKALDDSLNEVKQIQRDNFFQKREDSLAEVYKLQIDSSHSKSVRASNEALAKYNIVLIDSLNKVSGKINIKVTPDPKFALTPIQEGPTKNFIEFENGITYLALTFHSYQATAYNIKTECFILKPHNNVDFRLVERFQILTNTSLPPGVFRKTRTSINPKLVTETDLHLVLYGSFSKSSNSTERIEYLECLALNFAENKIITIIENPTEERTFIEKYLKSKKL